MVRHLLLGRCAFGGQVDGGEHALRSEPSGSVRVQVRHQLRRLDQLGRDLLFIRGAELIDATTGDHVGVPVDRCASPSMLAYMQRTTVKLSDELDARLRHEAQRRGTTVSELTREAIEAHLGGART